MILVATSSLWCSLCVRGAGLRIEAMRFGLLLVLTVALLSVAFRINSHHTSSTAGPSGRPTAPPSSQPAGQPAGQPTSQPTGKPSTTATTPPSSPAARPHKARGSGQKGSAGSGAQTLPVTGWDDAVKLSALGFLMIGGGTLVILVATPRRQRPDTVQD